MRKGLISLIAATLILAVGALVFAQSRSDQQSSPAVDQILSQIRTELKLGPNDKISPDQVPAPLMVKLGDAVMDIMIPNQQQHAFMDQMMGGEGSKSLDSMHSWIAYRYLSGGYFANGAGFGMMGSGGMFGGGMMGAGNGAWGMMGNPGVPYASSPYQSPEQIAKERYAKGEITRDQYQQLLKDLQGSGKANGN